ncbi:MAG: WD40 repeat domain-containing protein [Myxococcales bacterium]|nr:WD40 repeat domain-containing protein [Myxococcales bacterium]MCB9578878.1 WD40 repeat domain-containing protein [Polyangiaceae bacterium]
MPRWSKKGALVLGVLALACGAAAPPPAAAKPRAARAPAAHRARPAIGAATADRVKLSWEAAAGGYGRAVAVSSRLGRVAFANRDTVRVYDLGSGKRVGDVRRCQEIVHTGLGFVDSRLVIVCEDGVSVVSADKLGKLPSPKTAPARVTAAAFAGKHLALGHHDGVVRILDLAGGAGAEIVVPGPPVDVKSLALSPDGNKVAVAWTQGSIWWWNVSEPEAFHKLVRHESEADAVAFDASGSVLAEEGAKNTTTLWSFGDPPKETAHLKNGDWVKQIRFTPDGKWLARGGSDGLELAEIAGPKRVALDTRGAVEDVAFDEQSGVLAAADRDGRLTVWAVR